MMAFTDEWTPLSVSSLIIYYHQQRIIRRDPSAVYELYNLPRSERGGRAGSSLAARPAARDVEDLPQPRYVGLLKSV